MQGELFLNLNAGGSVCCRSSRRLGWSIYPECYRSSVLLTLLKRVNSASCMCSREWLVGVFATGINYVRERTNRIGK